MNKGIIVIGSAGSGKTTFIKSLFKKYDKELEWFKWINQDFIVEDKDHKLYNNPLQASKFIKQEVFPEILNDGRDFIWDCTGANIKPIKKLIEENPNYNFKIIIQYCEPLICYLRNFHRKRRLPSQIVIENWLRVYSQIQNYIKLVGSSNIYVHESDYSDTELKNSFLYQDKFILKHFELNPKSSSFKKSKTKYTKEDLLKKHNKFIKILSNLENSYDNIENEINNMDFNGNFIISLGTNTNLYKWISENK